MFFLHQLIYLIIHTFLYRIIRGIVLCEKNHIIPFKKVEVTSM